MECFPVSLFEFVDIVGIHQVFSISLCGTLLLEPMFARVGFFLFSCT